MILIFRFTVRDYPARGSVGFRELPNVRMTASGGFKSTTHESWFRRASNDRKPFTPPAVLSDRMINLQCSSTMAVQMPRTSSPWHGAHLNLRKASDLPTNFAGYMIHS